MRELEKGKEKIQKICDMLREETLLPAQQEAKRVIDKAQQEAERIVHEAHTEAKRIITEAHAELDKEKKAVRMALELAAKQSIGSLKQDIEKEIFDDPLKALVVHDTKGALPVAALINALVKAIEKEGIETRLAALVPKNCPVTEVAPLLLQDVVKRLGKEGIEVGNFDGGVQLRLVDKQIAIDITDQALKDLLAAHLRKEFRKYVFGS